MAAELRQAKQSNVQQLRCSFTWQKLLLAEGWKDD